MKLWERVVEARLRKVVEICEQQYGFMPRKSTTDAIFALRILMEKYRDGQRELHCVFVDLEKAYDRVPREELWYCMRKSGVAETYVRVVQDMYERSRTVVRCAVGQTEEFKVEVGLHQGSALSPFLFAIVMDQLSEEVRQESPWTMMFADDIVICSESREQVEENLERWRFALERRGMKVSGSKTEYMCVNKREGSGTVRLQGEEVKKVQEFKYLGSTVQSNGECGKEVKKRVQAGWNGWRKVWGVLCDRKISARIKGKVYRTVVRAAMLYGLETVSLRKRQESELEVAELKMLRFSLGVTRLDRIRNEYIRGTAHVGRLGDKVREARLRWFGHVQRRDSEYIGRRMLDMELPGRRQRGSCPQMNMEKVSWIYRMRGRRRALETMTLLVMNTMCLILILKILTPENCEKITSPKSVREAPEITSPTCERNLTASKTEGFFDYPSIIQEFLYYRHCRQFPMLLTLQNKCNIPKGSGEPVFLLAIKSSPRNYERRAVLRKTWATERLQNGMWIRTVFLSGTVGVGFEKKRINRLLELENKRHQDILQWDFTDSFYNLTLKQVLFLDWMQTWCPTADFFFNGDDDVFANTDNMVDFLKGQHDNDGSKHLYVGQLLLDSTPIRDNTSKYFIPEEIEAADMYSPYCSGGGYLFSRFTARSIYQMSKSIALMPIDDVYMGMCLKQAGLHPSDHQGVWADGLIIPSDKLDIYDPCHYREIILGHKFLPDQIFLLWNEIHRKDLNCSKTEVNL
ncbi:hypothetical protein QTP70_025379 [Hemibagrus guttatus]|uniref:ribonuclease H n=1 Tax=Hemibagrus guttatus TaxID=175788 RepID=A0AAE0V7H1_9TELE|nr:hypothetical protein QTP70_025379 [Hemibagrus guttatus]